MLTVVAPASMAALPPPRRGSRARCAPRPRRRTRRRPRTSRAPAARPRRHRRMISSLAILSLNSRWIGAGGQKTWHAPAGRVLERLPARRRCPPCCSASQAGDDAAPRPARLTPWTASKSPGEATGKPASMTSTPRSRSARATSSFSSRFIDAPGDCSPSRSVVSKMMMRSDPAWLTLGSPLVTAAGCGCWFPGCFDMSGPRAPGVGPKRVARLSRATSSAGWAEEVAAQRHPGRDTSPAGLRSRRVLHAGVIEPATIVPGAPGGQGSQAPPPHKAV